MPILQGGMVFLSIGNTFIGSETTEKKKVSSAFTLETVMQV